MKRQPMLKPIMYTGLELPEGARGDLVHVPLIEIKPIASGRSQLQRLLENISQYSLIIFTSKTAVRLFSEALNLSTLPFIRKKALELPIAAVGRSTGSEAKRIGFKELSIASIETAEGVVELLKEGEAEGKSQSLRGAHLLWPHSSGARSIISDYCCREGIYLDEVTLYDTAARQFDHPPSLDQFSGVFFTSPSTVDAFLKLFGAVSSDWSVECIGPVTLDYLQRSQKLGIRKRARISYTIEAHPAP